MAENVTIKILADVNSAVNNIKKVEGALKSVGGTSASIGGMMSTFTNLMAGGWNSVGAVLNIVVGIIGTIGKIAGTVFSAVADLVGKVIDVVSGLGTKLLWVAGILAGIGTAITYKIGRSVVELAGWSQQIRLGFGVMTGSAEKATETLDMLQAMALKMPFTFKGIVDSTRLLLAYGFELSRIPRLLTAISDAASAFGGSNEMIDRISVAIGQMKAMGFPSGQEMRQLAQAGIPAWQMLSDFIGKSTGETMKMAESRAISADTMIQALLSGIERRFGGMSAIMMKTLPGAWSNFIDLIQKAERRIGEKLAPTFTKLINGLNAGINYLEKSGAFDRLAKWVEGLFSPENLMKAINFFTRIGSIAITAFNWIRNTWNRTIDAITSAENQRKAAELIVKIKYGILDTTQLIVNMFQKYMAYLEAMFGPVYRMIIKPLMDMTRYTMPVVDQAQRQKDISRDVNQMMGWSSSFTAGIRNLVTPPVGKLDPTISGFFDAIKGGLKTSIDPIQNPLKAIQENTAAIASNTSGFDDAMRAIYGGGDRAKGVLTNLTFGNRSGLPESLRKRDTNQTITIRIEGGSRHDQDIVNQTTTQLLNKLGIPQTRIQPVLRGSTI